MAAPWPTSAVAVKTPPPFSGTREVWCWQPAQAVRTVRRAGWELPLCQQSEVGPVPGRVPGCDLLA